MKKTVVSLIILSFLTSPCLAKTFDGMLGHHASSAQTFLGYQYKNIQWVSHTPTLPPDVKEEPAPDEADYRGQE